MKARNYRKAKGQLYTRKKYIRGFPSPKITKFTMGESKNSYGYKAVLISQKTAQIRHNALEATRVATNRFLSENLGTGYLLRILPYPHVVLRENKMIFGAHADRLQDGMRAAFGKAIGTAARIDVDQAVLVAYVNEDGIEVAKEALKRGRAKLPVPCRIIIEKIGD